jgi:hypothetical protein
MIGHGVQQVNAGDLSPLASDRSNRKSETEFALRWIFLAGYWIVEVYHLVTNA